MSPRSSTIILPWMTTRRSLTIQTIRKSLTSRKTHARILDSLVFHQCLNSLFCTFLIGESKESMQSGNRYLTERERKEREGFVISAAESMSKKGRRNSIRSHSLQTHRKFCSDGWDLRGHLEGRAQQAILGEISIQRKLYSTECNMEIQNIERRNSEYALFESQRELDSQRHKLLDANQSMLNVRDSEWVMKDHLHQESHARCCREIGMLRNTREDMSIPGNVFDCQHARRDSDALCNDSRNLATLLGILGTEGIEKIESEEPLLSTPLSCSQVRERLKSLNGGKCPVSMTNHAAGIATCAQGMTIPSYLSSEMHLQKIPWPNEISELDREFPSWRLREKRRISRSYCSGSRDQSNQLAEDQNQLREKISLIMKNWIWWWRQNWNGDTTLLIWSTKLPTVEPWQDKKGEKLLHRVAEDNWILFKKRHLQFSPHACHGTPWDCVERSGRRREVSPGKGIPFSTEKRKNRLTWKAQTVWRLVLRLELKIPCLWRSRWKRSSCDYRHHPVCRGYKSGNRCIYGHRCLFRHADGERKPQREFEKKKVLKEQVRLWEEKTSKVVYLKTQIQRILFYGKWKNWDWTLRRDTPWNSWDASGTNYPKKANLMSEILARSVLRNEHLRKPHDKQMVTAKLRGICREECTMLSGWDLGSDKIHTLRRRSRNHMTVLTVNRKVQINEDAQVLFTISVCS